MQLQSIRDMGDWSFDGTFPWAIDHQPWTPLLRRQELTIKAG